MKNIKKLELLAPAKNYEYGVAAINCGADAIYIGAPDFGARKAASNSVKDIARLVNYAHLFDVKVYVAFNTIIFDDEIKSAEILVSQLYEIGVDALIIQDMTFSKMQIPPIKLFASTQTANLTKARVEFLESIGFERVILERALSINEIKEICESTNVDIECFVHGAICVSYSGNCYMSELVAKRSANRGECAQPCRSTYDLIDEDDNIIAKNQHLLSIKDLSLDNSIDKLIDAGVSSFKIEGRLKDIVYLKNSVTHFNNLLNKHIENNPNIYCRSSKGYSITDFTPNTSRSFSRQFTSYFLDGKQNNIATFGSAKSIGEYIGTVKSCSSNKITIDKENNIELTPGDGICFFSSFGKFSGCYINRVNNQLLEVSNGELINVGSKIYRNYDKQFVDKLSNSIERRVLDVTIDVEYGKATIYCNNNTYSVPFDCEDAKNKEKAIEGIISNFSKSGGSIFRVSLVNVIGDKTPFLPIKIQNHIRTTLFTLLEQKISDTYIYEEGKKLKPSPLKEKNISYKLNIANKLSAQFYMECGAENIEEAVEITQKFVGIELMRMGYCIRREIGKCLKNNKDHKKLFLVNNNRRFELIFDCSKCEMSIKI